MREQLQHKQEFLPQSVGNCYQSMHSTCQTKRLELVHDSADRAVLVVEDCCSARMALVHYLTALKFDVVSCATGEEALELAKNRTFQAVFMDVSLPGMSGIETIDLLRQTEPDKRTPNLVVCSAYEQSTLPKRVQDCSFLPKPVTRKTVSNQMGRMRLAA